MSLSSLCKLIWRHWTYKMPVRYILSSVWVRLSIFSQLSVIQYMGLCVFSLPIPLWWLREYILCLIIIIESEVWTITHCLGFGHETMVCAVCLSIFLWKNISQMDNWLLQPAETMKCVRYFLSRHINPLRLTGSRNSLNAVTTKLSAPFFLPQMW